MRDFPVESVSCDSGDKLELKILCGLSILSCRIPLKKRKFWGIPVRTVMRRPLPALTGLQIADTGGKSPLMSISSR